MGFPESRLRLIVLDAARQSGGCPFQVRNLCGVHSIKPLGCRLYFCDKSAQQWQNDLSERLLARIRALHDEQGIEYRYGEWREMLARFAAA
jgi:Fe-S-cluster containining protein